MRGEVLGRVERRRRWSVEEKLAVVMASLEPDAVVSDVARRFDVTRQQVYDWRRAARRGDLGAPAGVMGFIEVVSGAAGDAPVMEMECTPAAPSAMATVEIVLVGGRVLRAPAGLPTSELRRLIGAVERA